MKRRLPLENISVVVTSDGWNYDNDIVNTTERTFEGRSYLLITYSNGESVAVRSNDVVTFRYHKRKESKIKTIQDVITAWKDGRLIEVD